jgi:hypothetical protein
MAIIFVGPTSFAITQILNTSVTTCGRALLFAPEELKNDTKIFLFTVTHNGDSLQFTSVELKAISASLSCGHTKWSSASLRRRYNEGQKCPAGIVDLPLGASNVFTGSSTKRL